MTKTKLLNFLNMTGTHYSIYTEDKYMIDEAVKLGAVISICVRGRVDFYFDKKGKILGTSTDSIDSWKKANIKKV
jgi:hypothetical protein